jgi:hypothetical protein
VFVGPHDDSSVDDGLRRDYLYEDYPGKRLTGGFINEVVQVGDTVRRPAAPDFVHRLLRHFEAVGWPGAPRYLGRDEKGREVLTFIAGWQYVGLGPDIVDPVEAARRVGVLAGAYGGIAREPLIETILWWQDRCWRGIAEKAAAGEPAMVRLRDLGAVEDVRAAYDWTAAHLSTLAA